MAEAILVLGVEKLLDLLVRESDRFKGVDGQLNELKSDLNFLSEFLKDADAKKHSLKSVINCVKEIKEVVLDTEDIIETFILKEELSKTKGIRKCMRRLSFITVDRRELASDMVGISKRISKVIKQMKALGVKGMIVDDGECSNPLQEREKEMRETFPSNNENALVGLEENVKKLVGYLVEENSIQVVSITGMGGIGKTTLARQVFNHKMVKNHFDGIVWVCISQQFSKIDVWQTILKKLSSSYDEQRDSKLKVGELQEKLFRLLETSNKYLIVLDDMWKEEDWDRIEPAFPSKKGYWKVLLTSRYETVGVHADSNCITFKPDYLTNEESWTLFQSIAFPREDTAEFKVDVEMEEMGKEMIKHCGGLPLAVKVLGGLLAQQFRLRDWKRVCEDIGRNISSVYQILNLSFEELPFYLKQCFLYLAHFPEDCEINVERLSYYWAAEAIPRPTGYGGATVREVAEKCIAELVKRNMVISQKDAITSRFETCQLHDMMREVCVRKAKEENFVNIVDVANSQSPCKSRRIAYTLVRDQEKSYDPKGMMKNPKLRSLLFFGLVNWYPYGIEWTDILCSFFSMYGNWMPWDLLFTRLQLLRVLDLSFAKFKGEKLPSSIGKLIHLRYLKLYQAHVTHLPSSMRNLKQLLYLNLFVDGISSVYMPNHVLNEMRALIYLCLPLHIHGKAEMELGNLVNLETLENFSTKHSNVKDLHQMTRLETLSIIFNGECTMETLASSLSELRHLENLSIYGEDSRNNEEGFVLDFIHLRHLKLHIYMPRLPDEQHFPSHLTTLSLSWCRLEEDPMPILEKLLHLYQVRLSYDCFRGKKMVCSGGGFPQLQKLDIYQLKEWEKWIVEEGSMPRLHTLTIAHCKKLKELPDGLRFISSLKELNIKTAHLEYLKEKLSEGGEDFYKVQHIPLLKIELGWNF